LDVATPRWPLSEEGTPSGEEKVIIEEVVACERRFAGVVGVD